jgi:hypothetical protein
MAAFADLCRFIPTAGGTTDWTYSSAVGGCQSPAAAGVQNGVNYKVYSVSSDLTQWEVSQGSYNSGTGVFPRTIVLYNSSGTGTATGQSGAGTKINFTTVPQVSVVGLAEDLPNLTTPNTFTDTTEATGAGTTASGIFSGGVEILKKLFVTGIATFKGGLTSAGAILSTLQNSATANNIDTTGSQTSVVASAGNLVISGNTAGLVILRENTATGDELFAMLGTFGVVTILANPSGNWSNTAAPANGKYGLAQNGSNQWAIYNGGGGTARQFNIGFWVIR